MQLQLLKLLTPRMKVNATNTPHPLIKAYIIESLKTSPTNTLHPMIRHQKQLLPSHKQMILAERVRECECGIQMRGAGSGGFEVFAVEGAEGREAGPVLQVDFGGRVQGGVCG